MQIIGLTGSFGTGKSLVASIFKRFGAEVIDADRLAHEAIGKGLPAYKRIIAVFGETVLDKNGSINRKKLAAVVFSSKKRLDELNKIIHPGVIKSIKERTRVSKKKILVIDAPLLCEAGLSGLADILVVVKASREKQIRRSMKKFRMSKSDVCKRISCQLPLQKKAGMADYVVDNNGSRKKTEKEVRKIWQEIKKGAKAWK